MAGVLYGFSKNGIGRVREYLILKETEKTYRLKYGSSYEVVRKATMSTNYMLYFTSKEEAEAAYESIVHPKKTNGQVFREMPDAELAKFICTLSRCSDCVFVKHCGPGKNGVLEWLKKEFDIDEEPIFPW